MYIFEKFDVMREGRRRGRGRGKVGKVICASEEKEYKLKEAYISCGINIYGIRKYSRLCRYKEEKWI